jgi:hypothetical protein
MTRIAARGPLHLHGSRTGRPAGRLDLSAGPDFMTDRARGCAPGKVDPKVFHPLDGDSPATRRINRINRKKATATCAGCPFHTKCATWALDHGERDGVWGGFVMDSVINRERAASQIGWKPGRKPPTQSELRAQRVAAAAAETARVEAVIREMWGRGKSDGAIAMHLGLAPGSVNKIRIRLGLATLYGPGGRPAKRQLVDA